MLNRIIVFERVVLAHIQKVSYTQDLKKEAALKKFLIFWLSMVRIMI